MVAAYLVARRLAPRWQGLVGAVGLVLSLGIALSRPYLQVHDPSDVVAGWSASLAWVLGVWVWYVARRDRASGGRFGFGYVGRGPRK